MRSNPLKWFGGKQYLAKRILSLLPAHKHYVEPYFGGGAVLLARENYEGVSEVVNDLNGELINFWRVLQCEQMRGLFIDSVNLIPFAEGEFHVQRPDTVIDRAIQFFIKYRMSRTGMGKDFATLSRNRTRRGMNEQAASWISAIESLPEACERLHRVVILNRPALEVIKQQDGENSFFYLDPPYMKGTRVAGEYECEMSDADHEELLVVLSRLKGRFILSGYPSVLYEDYRVACNWNRIDIAIDNKASSAAIKETKTECLWRNYTLKGEA